MNLKELEEYASVCTACSLHEGRNKPVFSKGSSEASIMICGMVPADEENKAGLPFVGRAGQLLDVILEECGLTLNDIYITNLVKCYLKAGLSLKQEWIDNCLPYIITQIDIVKPKVIVTLGKDASKSLLGLYANISLGKIKGKKFDYSDEISIVPTYHPSYLLRAGGVKHKHYPEVIEHFEHAKNLL